MTDRVEASAVPWTGPRLQAVGPWEGQFELNATSTATTAFASRRGAAACRTNSGRNPTPAGWEAQGIQKLKIWWAFLIVGFLIFYWWVDHSEKENARSTAQPRPSSSPTESIAQPTIPVLPTVPVVIETVISPVETGPEYFVTPSGNIGCYLNDESARCDIVEKDWPAPPKPPACLGDWGHGLSVAESGPGTVCAGDTVLGGPVTLGYGLASQRGNYRCEVSEQGVTCTNLATSRGFKISRASYDFF